MSGGGDQFGARTPAACCLLDTVRPYGDSDPWSTGVFDVDANDLSKRNLPWALLADTLGCFVPDSNVNPGGSDPVEFKLEDDSIAAVYRSLKGAQYANRPTDGSGHHQTVELQVKDAALQQDGVSRLLTLLAAAVHVQADCLYLKEPSGVGQFRYRLGPVNHCAMCKLRTVLDVTNPNVDRFTTGHLVILANWMKDQLN